MTYKLNKKVAEKHLDELIDTFYQHFATGGRTIKYVFDFSEVEWMSNEELLTFTGLFKSLIDSDIDFNVQFLKDGSSETINKRKAKQIIQLWDVWKIYSIVPHKDYNLYFDIDGNFIERLRAEYNIQTVTQEIYESYGITPFVTLEKIESYDDQRIVEKLHEIYRLEAATSEILHENNCYLPFHNETLTSIVSKELFENFLDHYDQSLFSPKSKVAFLSLVLKRKLNTERLGKAKVQEILKRNFKEESFPELRDFYVEMDNPDVFLNRSLLQLSFVDFGEGIPKTLKSAYYRNTGTGYSKEHTSQNEDTRILEYAFKHDSSQHELKDKYSKEFAVPRGLFDLLSVVKRFEGVIIARSHYGKIAFDFSCGKSMEEAVRYFGDQSKIFPGTLFTIYIPEREIQFEIDSSSIKPYDSLAEYSFKKNEVKHVSLFEIQTEQKNQKTDKGEFYNILFDSFLKKIQNNSETLIYLDFTGWEIDERVTKKIIFFLCTDYRINLNNNVIVVNPPSKRFLASIRDQLLDLEEVHRRFKIHPTPFVFFDNNELEIFWLGIFSEQDIEKLNKLLFEEHDLRKSDFENPEAIIGHINHYDNYGNLVSIINSTQLKLHYTGEASKIEDSEIEKIIAPCIKSSKDTVYLCNGNYYQYQYLELFDALSDEDKRKFLNEILLRKIQSSIDDWNQYILVGITSSSHKIVDYFESRLGGDRKNYVRLNNYFSFEEEAEFKQGIYKGSKVILLCDVVSTGYMVERFISRLNILEASIEKIGVLVDAIDTDFNPDKYNYSEIKNKIISVYKKPLKKYTRNNISAKLKHGELKVIRINPFTNTPITQGIDESNYNKSVLLNNEDFAKLISVDQIQVGYFNFNSLVHPYFFNMHSILSDPRKSQNLITQLFDALQKQTSLEEIGVVFYPKSSGIHKIDFKLLQDKYFKNHNTLFFELERFLTNEGWRFPHPPQYLVQISREKRTMILDDGSCSGESISQMIDEVSFLNVKSITVLSLVGRINNHKREFFSRIKKIDSGGKEIPVKIFFGSNWHIPTYHQSKSPVIEENKWLDQLIQLPNIPQGIKTLVKTIKKEITPKEISEGNSSYLLKTKEGFAIHDELALVRNEFGKISEYRFYKEYFQFFDQFISYHESKNSKERGHFPYRKIEAVCAVFLHEPYLFDKVKAVIPDVVDKIEKFVELFVIENKIPQDLLCYQWNKKDMIHLLFIIYKDETLLDILNNNLKKLLIFSSDSQSTVNYFLYKLLKYFPLEKSETRIKRLDNQFKEILENVETDNVTLNKQIKKFYNFLKTLPSGTDIESLLRTLRENYKKEKEPDLHDDKISFNHNISLILGKIREAMDKIESKETIPSSLSDAIVKGWFQVFNFISPILTFSITYEEYLAPFPYFKLLNTTERDSDSLRTLVGANETMIFSIDQSFNDINKLKKIERNTILIQSNFSLNTDFHRLIEHRWTDWSRFYQKLEKELKRLELKVKLDNQLNKNHLKIQIPKIYSYKLIIDELINNLKNHCKKEKGAEVYLCLQDIGSNGIQLHIINPIADISHSNSNGEGTKCLNLLSTAGHFGFEYQAQIKEGNYDQILKFQTL
ncbi:hypothetical protein SAMN06296241_1084 [Salinimicrobium sediminis]|uniref:Uncharacterized protein n=1 Tax=Salinimicrobium sediminis TaxID=1343891 RepID=A0A285X2L5_9FLAO|nr:hypothetical protein [Salinimicrobium sediminis]SOC79555.1 hypothetical protein SAMN06296241_1084 [Salinimicrobium sediminis]